MNCPECGAEMILRRTEKFRWKNGKGRLFYGCTRFPACKGTHGAHPDGRPLGIPADTATKAWRHKAHVALDEALPESPKRKQYQRIQELMGLGEEDAHIGRFTAEQCQELIVKLGGKL